MTGGGSLSGGRGAAWLPALALAASLAASPFADGAEVTKHYADSLLAEGERGIFVVEMLPPKGGMAMGVNAVEIIVHDRQDRDVPGAAVKVVPRMPEHRHGVEEEPVVFDRGGGVYSVENIVLVMTGWWELEVEIRKGELEDRAVFSFPEVGAAGGSGPAAAEKSGVDTSSSARSAAGVFSVAYESSEAPVPLNRLHRWTLTVTTADGRAVEGAAITVVGDMPEHGHGLPTQPEVTTELGGGRYVVDGIRFSMPGWWVMTFHIASTAASDNVSFNVLVE